MTLQWVAFEATTGKVIADLPDLDVEWPLRRTIGAYDTGTAHLPLPTAPENWTTFTVPWAAGLACYDDEDPQRTPQWAGFIVSADLNQTDVVDLSLVTAEGYFDRCYVGDVTYTATGQNEIAADLVEQFCPPNSWDGIPITTSKVGGDGTTRDRVYYDVDDTTLYTRLQQLMGVRGGPEWTVVWEWTDGSTLGAVFTVGDRIGTAVPDGLGPAASFDLPGSVVEFHYVTDYTSGKGANVLTAVSSGQGDSRPTSGPQAATDMLGRPAIEYRWTPSSSITDTDTLAAYAKGALALIGDGSRSLTLTAHLATAPRYGVDWQLGDDVGYNIVAPAFPMGLSGVARCIAYEMSGETVTPILAVAGIPTGDEGDDA